MTHSRLWLAASIIAVVIIGSFVLSVPHTRDIPGTSSTDEVPAPPPVVKVHDVFRKGTHTLTGTVEAPNPCTTISASAAFASEATTTGAILITIDMPKDEGTCLQQATNLPFSLTVAAPAGVPIQATVNGQDAALTML